MEDETEEWYATCRHCGHTVQGTREELDKGCPNCKEDDHAKSD